MSGALGWSAERAGQEVAAWRRRVAAERAGEAEPDDDSALQAYRAALEADHEPVAAARLRSPRRPRVAGER
jgi:hypothetical protein